MKDKDHRLVTVLVAAAIGGSIGEVVTQKFVDEYAPPPQTNQGQLLISEDSSKRLVEIAGGTLTGLATGVVAAVATKKKRP